MNLDLKSNFLQKKKQEKKKVEQKHEDKNRLLKLQKNLRAFVCRKKLQNQSKVQNDLELALLLKMNIASFPQESIKSYIQKSEQKPENQKIVRLSKIVLSCLKNQSQNLFQTTLKIIEGNSHMVSFLTANAQYVSNLQKMLGKGYCGKLFQLCLLELIKSQEIHKFPTSLLLELACKQFSKNYMANENQMFSFEYSDEVIITVINIIGGRKNDSSQLNKVEFSVISIILLKMLRKIEKKQIDICFFEKGFIFLVNSFRSLLARMRRNTIEILLEKNKGLLNLIEDEEELEYFENRLTLEKQFQSFCDKTLNFIEMIFNQKLGLEILMKSTAQIQFSLSSLISDINTFYEAKKILFVYSFLSEENNLKAMSKEKNPEFYVALKMKLMTMDDDEFASSQLFTAQQWKDIISSSISASFYLIKKILMNEAKNKNIRLIPFALKNDDQSLFLTLTEVMNNLYKKCLRTKMLSPNLFIDKQLDLMFNKFAFGMGAKALEIMLKNFPFVFRFESRMAKFQEFIKADKKNYDRTLFLQEEVDDDLIITVRRNNEFLDAYHACMNRDLRKKYKIIFYNEQGLEEEGIDGGGIIKEFINRVLKASFSQIFGMFYETEQHQILPNSFCNLTQEYEFVGKLIGKAVYEGINIEQKFAEPFLNLVIGRKNGFEELQFVDRQIYKSMLQLKRMGTQIQSLEQTFTILDQLPNKMKQYVNLRNLSDKEGKSEESLVTNENKMEFIMSYADYKCNKQLEEKTRLFRRGFLKVMKSEWLTMFSNQELNQIISGGQPNFSVEELKRHVVFYDYHEKSQTIQDLWKVLVDFSPEQKCMFLLYVTSCSRPPTLGFGALKPLMCIHRSQQTDHLPTANTCMNVLRLPDYNNLKILQDKLLYAINAKAGFQFA